MRILTRSNKNELSPRFLSKIMQMVPVSLPTSNSGTNQKSQKEHDMNIHKEKE